MPRFRAAVRHFVARVHLVVLPLVPLVGCGGLPSPLGNETDREGQSSLSCSIPDEWIADGGVPRDGIPALTNPELVGPTHDRAQYVRPSDRVAGVVLGEQAIAVPHNILWWHEIVNLDVEGESVAVTNCPLTGSTLVFDRGAVNDQEFIVSGLLFYTNLIMTTREVGKSLFPQMSRGARCGPRSGLDLPLVPYVETTWSLWRELHPDTRVVSSATGFDRDYRLYPYGDYDELHNDRTLFPVPEIDQRRPPKARVLGIPFGGKGGPFNEEGGIAYPFLDLAELGPVAAVEDSVDGSAIVVLWDGASETAAAYHPRVAEAPGDPSATGTRLSFEVVDGEIVDRETGSVWNVNGTARSGELADARLEPHAEDYVAFWFAWALFQPATRIWSGS